MVNAFNWVIADSERVPGAIWALGKTLAGHAMRAMCRGLYGELPGDVLAENSRLFRIAKVVAIA